jgi:HK97 family phage prohead protease
VSGTEYGLPFEIETKRLDGDTWEVSGYASTYDRDLGDDVIVPGAFQKSLANGRPVRFLFSHDHRQPIGKALELREDERGLFGRFAISKTALGGDVRTLLRDGALDSFSIGYLPKESEIDKKEGVRRLKEVELLEVSVVSMPMNPGALVTGIKELDGSAIAQAVADYVAGAERRRQARPLEEVLDEAHAEVKALWERRLADGREPSPKNTSAVAAYRQALLDEADALAAYLPSAEGGAEPGTAAAPDEAPVHPEPEAKAEPVTDAPQEPAARAERPSEVIERERHKRRLLRKFGGIEVPEPDPIAGFERLPVLDPLTGKEVA